jgi:hypothetical protein
MRDLALLQQPEQMESFATLDCEEAFSPFSSDDLARLRRYLDICESLAERRFFTERINFSARISIDRPNYENLEHAGEDALRSAVLDFRQLWMDKEITHFPTIRNRLRRRAVSKGTVESAIAISELDRLGKKYSDERNRSMMRRVHPENPTQAIAHIRAHQVVEDWLYGGVIHFDPDSAARVKAWPPSTYEWTLIKSIHGLVKVYLELTVLVDRILNREAGRSTGERETSVHVAKSTKVLAADSPQEERTD